MIDYLDIKLRCSSCDVYFKNLPFGSCSEVIYIENEYHVKFNRYLRLWGWWLQKRVFDKYESGYKKLLYLPSLSKKQQHKLLQYQFPNITKEMVRKLPNLKTIDLLDYLEDPDDTRFLKPGFLFYKEAKNNGITVYEYYPLVSLDCICLSYKEQIAEILSTHKENANEPVFSRGLGHRGIGCTRCPENEDYADNMFTSLDEQTQAKLFLFKQQVEELQKRGVPMALLENILHQNENLSKLVITKKYEIVLPDYNNMVIKMEPLVKAVFLLFLMHPEGIVFKHLPDYKQELIDIYKNLRPYGLNKRSLQSIEDVIDPTSNSINEKCARIRAAFVDKFDIHLAKNYFITGERGEPKRITLPRELVEWE